MQFIDPILQKTFERKGFVVIDLLGSSEIEQLQKIYTAYPANQVANFQVSNYEKDPKKNRDIDQGIRASISGKISGFVKDYRSLTAYFYIKFPGKESAFYIHKDWTVVDESRYSSIHIWIPLSDITRQNGNLFFCPFDYRKKLTYRGSPGFESPEPDPFTHWVNKFYKVDIYLKCGQAICFKHNMTHGSRPNLTDTVRVAAGISLIPSDAPLLHYHRDKNGEIHKYEVADDFYLDFDLNNPPENFITRNATE